MIDDSDQIAWLHNEERQALRAGCLLILMKEFGGALNSDGSPKHGNKTLYAAAHDYVSHGNKDPGGIIAYYLENRGLYS